MGDLELYLGAGTLCLPLFIKRGEKNYGTNFYSGTNWNVSVHHRKVLASRYNNEDHNFGTL